MNTRAMANSSRLIRRLLIFVWVVLVVCASGANAAPVKTLVQDTLYRADGSAAQGSVTIRWNGFSTSAGEAVAAGQMTVTTDANGGISIPLIPNTGSSPSGSYYRVVIKLDDGTTSEEMWVVPALTTTTVAAIRAKVVPQAVAAQFASRDYLDSALAGLTASPTFSGAVTAQSVNGVPSVLGYGAKCDGVTNDSAAFTAADALGVSVLVPSETAGACVIASNITLNSQWVIPQGAKLSPSSGITLTMAHTPQAGLYQIFTGAGQVQFSNQPVVYPEWWGAVPALSTSSSTFPYVYTASDSYPALVSACASLPLYGTTPQLLYSGADARVGTIKFQVLNYLISHPWTCSYGVSYTVGDETGNWNGQATLELEAGAVPSPPAAETFAWFIDPPVSGGAIHSNIAFGTRINGVAVAVDGNKLYRTTLTTAITATGSQTITVGSTSGMTTSGAGSQVQIGTGADFEIVTPSSITNSTQFVATVANTHAAAEPIAASFITNYVSGLWEAQAQGSSMRNTGASHAWGRGCVFMLAPSSVNTDHLACASTLNGPNVDVAGTGAFDFVDAGNNNQPGVLGEVETRGPSSGGYTYTIPFVGGFVSGSSQVLVVSSYSGRYQNCGPSFCGFTRLSCGSTPTAGQYAECPTGVLTFNSADALEFLRILYQDTSPITASVTQGAVKLVPSIQVEANSDLHINQVFCEGSYDCLNTYKVTGLSIDYLEAHSTVQPANSAAVFLDQYSNNVLLPKQKYSFYGANQWTWGVIDRAHAVARTLVTDANNDSYARDTYSAGFLAVPASGTPPTGMVAATPGFVYPDGVTIAESSNGQISAALATSTTAGTVKPDNYSVTIAGGVISAAAATESVVGSPIARTGLAANISPTLAYTVPSGSPGWYKVSCYTVITQAATTSSTLPLCVINFNDADTGVNNYLTLTQTKTNNTVGTNGTSGVSYSGTTAVYAGAGAINYYTSSYASSGTTPMQYALHVKVEYLGQ